MPHRRGHRQPSSSKFAVNCGAGIAHRSRRSLDCSWRRSAITNEADIEHTGADHHRSDHGDRAYDTDPRLRSSCRDSAAELRTMKVSASSAAADESDPTRRSRCSARGSSPRFTCSTPTNRWPQGEALDLLHGASVAGDQKIYAGGYDKCCRCRPDRASPPACGASPMRAGSI